MATSTIVQSLVWLAAAAAGQRPRIGPLRDGAGAGRFQHSEWSALLGRFAQNGGVEYATMRRVRRLVEAYLSRLAENDPETFADADDQLAFYLNAYNAIAIHQVLLHYPVASIRAIPGAFTRAYPVGRRNLSLHTLHANMLRTFGDPRIHVAICTTARSSGQIQAQAYTGSGLQAELDTALRRLLGDQTYGARLDTDTNTLFLSSIFRLFGGDFLQPHTMPRHTSLILAGLRKHRLVQVLIPCLPAELAIAVRQNQPQAQFLPPDWSLNERVVSH